MKIKLSELRSIIKEALEETHAINNFKVGDWLVINDPDQGFDGQGLVAKLFKLEKMGNFEIAHVKTTFGYDKARRADLMFQNARLATPEEVAQAQKAGDAERNRLSKVIDTSREGT